jgi:DNA invertase Pin-like site-specific DNA recombinase
MEALKPAPKFGVLIMSEESRLGREQIEVSFALKQLVQAGVRVFLYLTDTERTLNSPIEKAMLALQVMADEMERARAAQRVTDSFLRKAQQGHVCGGKVFGYDNVPVIVGGERSHVTLHPNEDQAAIVRSIFERFAGGQGLKQIARALNDAHAPCPRAQQHRPSAWSPSTVRAILHRPLYRGEYTYNATKKRDA